MVGVCSIYSYNIHHVSVLSYGYWSTAVIYAATAQEFRAEYPTLPMHRTFDLWFGR